MLRSKQVDVDLLHQLIFFLSQATDSLRPVRVLIDLKMLDLLDDFLVSPLGNKVINALVALQQADPP